mgnify:CR=1 FL=1
MSAPALTTHVRRDYPGGANPRLRISVTDVDQWCWWLGEDQPIEVLRARLQRKEPIGDPDREASRVGTALHKALQLARDGEPMDCLRSQGYTFTVLCEAEISLPDVCEVRVQWLLDVDGVSIEVRGRLDGIDAFEVTDHKTGASFDPERMMSAWQWRIYLCMTGRAVFRWNHFTLRQRAGLPHYDVTEVNVLRAYLPPHPEAEVRATLAEFVQFALAHELYTGPTAPPAEPQEEPISWEAMV